MCGILVYINKINKITASDILKFQNGLESIKHRGPDSSRTLKENNILFGHNLLSITGNHILQPIQNMKKNTILCYNGEIYQEQKQEQSDTLFLLNNISNNDLNSNFFSHLNGEFAFVCKKENDLYLVRDRFGIKPLYIYENETDIIISSEIKAFKSFYNLEFNDETLSQVLSMQYHDDKTSLFKNITPIYPGHYFKINLDNFKIKKTCYWETSYSNNIKDDSKLKYILKKAISKREQTHHKIGFTLSGGIDSASIVGLSQSKEKNTYNIKFNDFYDESNIANNMAKMAKTNHKTLKFSMLKLLKNLDHSIYHSEELAMNLHVSAKQLLFKKMKEDGIKVSLSGEGADELLLGYSHLQKEINSNYFTGEYLKNVHYSDEKNDYPIFINAKLNLGNKIKDNFLNNRISFNFNDYYKKIKDKYNLNKFNKVEKSNFLWIKMAFSNYILTALGDKLEMSESIEGRLPFLDNDFVYYANNLDINLKYNEQIEKLTLRNAVKENITEEIYNRQKHPFITDSKLDSDSITFIRQELTNMSNEKLYFIDNIKLNNFIKYKINEENLILIIMILSVYYLYKNFVKV